MSAVLMAQPGLHSAMHTVRARARKRRRKTKRKKSTMVGGVCATQLMEQVDGSSNL